jgi:hypothetical protein
MELTEFEKHILSETSRGLYEKPKPKFSVFKILPKVEDIKEPSEDVVFNIENNKIPTIQSFKPIPIFDLPLKVRI